MSSSRSAIGASCHVARRPAPAASSSRHVDLDAPPSGGAASTGGTDATPAWRNRMTLTRDRRTELLAARAAVRRRRRRRARRGSPSGRSRSSSRTDHVIARQGEVGTGFFIVAERRRAGRPRRRDDRDARPGRLLRGAVGARRPAADRRRSSPTSRPSASRSRRWDFEAVVAEQPAVALAVLRGLAGRLRELTEADRH